MRLCALLTLMSTVFNKVLSLTCYECIPEPSLTCSQKKVECVAGHCGSMRTTSYVGGIKSVDMLVKNCTMPDNCITASVNFGITKTVISRQCCNTTLCNNQGVPEMTASMPNGRACYTCNGQDCSSVLNCEGDEELCIKTTVDTDGQRMTLRGCASRSFCMIDLSTHLGQSDMVVDQLCCAGNLCNRAINMAVSVLLLMMSKAFLYLLH